LLLSCAAGSKVDHGRFGGSFAIVLGVKLVLSGRKVAVLGDNPDELPPHARICALAMPAYRYTKL
jgi:hypothetical protein